MHVLSSYYIFTLCLAGAEQDRHSPGPHRAHHLPGNRDLKQELTVKDDIKLYEYYRMQWEQRIIFEKYVYLYLQDLQKLCVSFLFLLRLSSSSFAQ